MSEEDLKIPDNPDEWEVEWPEPRPEPEEEPNEPWAGPEKGEDGEG